MREHLTPAKSSPLKRSDGVMNLDQANLGSPRAKRRSLGAATFNFDFDIFDQGFDGAQSPRGDADDMKNGDARQRSPQRHRPFSLRRTTLQQRAASGTPRSKLFADIIDSPSSPAVPRTTSRMSLDGALPLRGLEPLVHLPAPEQKPPSFSAPKPHPLSKTLSPSSSSSSIGEDLLAPPTVLKPPQQRPFPGFSKSLPIGALRPKSRAGSSDASANDSFETPEAYKMAKPLPAAFMSTGLISKRNRNVDLAPASFGSSLNMPDTPSKKTTLPHLSNTPAPSNSWAKFTRPQHEFGSPTTPWSPHAVRASPESFGKGVSIFGSRCSQGNLTRRGSFLSVNDEDFQKSPSGHHLDAQSGDEMPPTPTKTASVGTGTIRPQSKGKGNSLRSTLFGRRSSLAPDTFTAPNGDASTSEQYLSIKIPAGAPSGVMNKQNAAMNVPSLNLTPCGSPTSPSLTPAMALQPSQISSGPTPLPLRSRELPSFNSFSARDAETYGAAAVTPTSHHHIMDFNTPRTPMESYTPPDPSGLTISGERQGSVLFGVSANSFPPATPTGPRDCPFNFSNGPGAGASASGFFANDVDTTLTSRFNSVQVVGIGEFSQVFRVEKPVPGSPAAQHQSLRRIGNVWAVKKTKKPYLGNKDRERKMREVEILHSLRGNEHIIDLNDTWESKGHLYIQTEFCENGNMKDFLTQTGFKGRLDDFRIWKILLEMSQGVKSIHDAGIIHLDLKPANILIDWEGVLKIADFGMASSWPAPKGLDGEGDREYIGPEVLRGQFDKPADIFALGMIMLEIAGNIVLPDNGTSWQRLRNGDMSDLPSLTFSSESSLPRDASGDPIAMVSDSDDTIRLDDDDDLGFMRVATASPPRRHDLVKPPNFMVDSNNEQALDKVVQWMINPDPAERPDVDQLLACGSVQWVEGRRRAGATVYEGAWGPADDVIHAVADIEMLDF
ncbi:hypothetical protein BT93_L4167 [Corymbia citriodora subsp. variegata]|uniref:Protein kinase domain-containing protein n=1 Tax=Corymbia citriodora subsp. variegata TaxID=360336 RepID=A0A8T0CGG1_CORYI|nr:hypothetical protein BT93_L4167 [Corymbia citriodora subsp. variegata]